MEVDGAACYCTAWRVASCCFIYGMVQYMDMSKAAQGYNYYCSDFFMEVHIAMNTKYR